MATTSRNKASGLKPLRRKGALRMADIPAEVLRGLNEGRLEAITLVESLAIDATILVRHVAPQIGLKSRAETLIEAAERLREAGVMQRLKGMGEAFHLALVGHPDRVSVLEALATHTSDTARTWAAYALAADSRPNLKARLKAALRFASDPSTAVRECAWDAIRPYVVRDLEQGIELLTGWARHDDERVRRCAIEATRPRGVWCTHIEELKKDPEPGRRLLELVKSDPSIYVRRSAANWLNDASKSQPKWVIDLCRRWLDGSPTRETSWIVNHGLRTLRKNDTVRMEFHKRRQPQRKKKK